LLQGKTYPNLQGEKIMYYADFADIIYGEEGVSPMTPTLKRCLTDCESDQSRLRIDIRSQQKGCPTSTGEHTWVIDPSQATADAILAAVTQRLNDSPGEGFHGQIRINFSQAGSSGVRYGSFSRMCVPNHVYRQSAETSYPSPHSPVMPTLNGLGLEDDLQSLEEGMGGMDPNQMQLQQLMKLLQQGGSGQPGVVDQQMCMQWLDNTMGFLFRSLSQQMAMFERATRMIETYSMRFGLPQSQMRVEHETTHHMAPESPEKEPTGAGLLPMLLNAATHLAGQKNPAGMLKAAGSMAMGKPPPTGTAKKAAMDAATSMLNKRKRAPSAPPVHAEPAEPLPEDESWVEEFPEKPDSDYMFDTGGNSSQRINPVQDGYEEESEEESDGDLDYGSFEDEQLDDELPDFSGLSAEEMKAQVVAWVKADPDNRKTAVMEMLPELSSVIMGE
jgi:hypothetical protein